MSPRRLVSAPLLSLVVLVALVGAACGSDSSPPTAAAVVDTPTVVATAEIEPSPTTALPTPTADAPTATATATLETTAEVENPQSPSAEVPRLSNEAWSRLVDLTESASPRASASDEEQAAADYLIEELEALGYSVDQQDFEVEQLALDVPVLSAVRGGEAVSILFGAIPMSLSGDGTAVGPLVDVGLAMASDLPEGRAGWEDRSR